METNWYIIYTEPKCEKKVVEILISKKFEHYCPLKKKLPQVKEKSKLQFEPLFTSYIFVKAQKQSQSEIRKINGVINFVYWLNEPAMVPDEEIDAIKKFLKNFTDARLKKAEVHPNNSTKIINGSPIEYEGNVGLVKNKTVKIILPTLGYTMIGERENIEVIRQRVSTKINSDFFNIKA